MKTIRQVRRWIAASACAFTIAVASLRPAIATEQRPIFGGKTISLIVGYASGGGYDSYARLMARFLASHIPGHPDIIVLNMPGAASLRAVQYLETAPKDGTAIAMFNPGLILQSLTSPEIVKTHFTDYTWIGTMSRDVRVCYVWNSSTKARTLDEMKKLNQFVFGETGTGSSAFIEQMFIRDILGVKVHEVLGYPGSAEKRLAVERGELDGDCGSWSSIPLDWLSRKKITIVLRFGSTVAPGMDETAPVAASLVPEKQQLLRLLDAPDDFGRPFILSKQTPPDRTRVLRKAFTDTLADPKFLAEAEKEQLPIIGPMGGGEAEKALSDIYKSSADVIAEAKTLTGQ